MRRFTMQTTSGARVDIVAETPAQARELSGDVGAVVVSSRPFGQWSKCDGCARKATDCPIGAPHSQHCIEFKPKGCQARQFSDQKYCNRCGLVWDVNDAAAPECLTSRQIAAAELGRIRHEF